MGESKFFVFPHCACAFISIWQKNDENSVKTGALEMLIVKVLSRKNLLFNIFPSFDGETQILFQNTTANSHICRCWLPKTVERAYKPTINFYGTSMENSSFGGSFLPFLSPSQLLFFTIFSRVHLLIGSRNSSSQGTIPS